MNHRPPVWKRIAFMLIVFGILYVVSLITVAIQS
jgi:hypothetical protein